MDSWFKNMASRLNGRDLFHLALTCRLAYRVLHPILSRKILQPRRIVASPEGSFSSTWMLEIRSGGGGDDDDDDGCRSHLDGAEGELILLPSPISRYAPPLGGPLERIIIKVINCDSNPSSIRPLWILPADGEKVVVDVPFEVIQTTIHHHQQQLDDDSEDETQRPGFHLTMGPMTLQFENHVNEFRFTGISHLVVEKVIIVHWSPTNDRALISAQSHRFKRSSDDAWGTGFWKPFLDTMCTTILASEREARLQVESETQQKERNRKRHTQMQRASEMRYQKNKPLLRRSNRQAQGGRRC